MASSVQYEIYCGFIGASTIVYVIIKGALLTPFTFPELGRLAMVWVELPTLQTTGEVVSGPEYLALAEQADLFEAVGAGLGTTFNMAGEGEPERIRVLVNTLSVEFVFTPRDQEAKK